MKANTIISSFYRKLLVYIMRLNSKAYHTILFINIVASETLVVMKAITNIRTTIIMYSIYRKLLVYRMRVNSEAYHTMSCKGTLGSKSLATLVT